MPNVKCVKKEEDKCPSEDTHSAGTVGKKFGNDMDRNNSESNSQKNNA